MIKRGSHISGFILDGSDQMMVCLSLHYLTWSRVGTRVDGPDGVRERLVRVDDTLGAVGGPNICIANVALTIT